MNIISLMVVLIVVGLLLWLVNNYIPMEARIKQILNIVVVIMVILWVLNAVGVMGMLPGPLVSVLVTLVVVGLLLWLVNTYIPMEGRKADIKYRGDYPGGALAAECIRGFVGNSIYSHRESVVLLALSSAHKGNP